MTRHETTTTLNTQTIEHLQDLVRINRDSAEGFRKAAELIQDLKLTELFLQIAGQREAFARELRGYVELNDEDGDISTSWEGMFHRWWLDVRALLSSGNDHAVLAEAERGEDKIKEMYEDVLKDTAGSPLNDVLMRQYAEVKVWHDAIRDMRDATKDNA